MATIFSTRIGDYTSSNLYTVRGPSCLLEAFASRPTTGTGREDPQSHTILSQLWFAVKRAFYAELRGEAASKKAPLEGFGG